MPATGKPGHLASVRVGSPPKTNRNDAEGLAQIMRTGWFRAVHVKSFDAHRARALLGARLQLVGMVTKLSNHIRGVLKTFGMLPGSVRGRSFAERVELLVAKRLEEEPGWYSASPLPGLLGVLRPTLPTLLLAFRRVVFAANVHDVHARRWQL